MFLGCLVLVSQLVDYTTLEDVCLEGEAEIIWEEVVAILEVEVGSTGVYFLVVEESKEEKQSLVTVIGSESTKSKMNQSELMIEIHI